MPSWLHIFPLSHQESDKLYLMRTAIDILRYSVDSQLNGLEPEVTGQISVLNGLEPEVTGQISVVGLFGVILDVWQLNIKENTHVSS
jgi:hypothetical protein